MKRMLWLFAVGILLTGSHVFAEDMVAATEAPAVAEEAAVVDAAATEKEDVGNLICPVGGEEIAKMGDGKGYTIEHNGKIYHLCCEMCAKDFQKDPEKYSKIAEDEVAKRKAEEAAVAE